MSDVIHQRATGLSAKPTDGQATDGQKLLHISPLQTLLHIIPVFLLSQATARPRKGPLLAAERSAPTLSPLSCEDWLSVCWTAADSTTDEDFGDRRRTRYSENTPRRRVDVSQVPAFQTFQQATTLHSTSCKSLQRSTCTTTSPPASQRSDDCSSPLMGVLRLAVCVSGVYATFLLWAIAQERRELLGVHPRMVC